MKEQIHDEPLFVYEYTRDGKRLATPSEELAHSRTDSVVYKTQGHE